MSGPMDRIELGLVFLRGYGFCIVLAFHWANARALLAFPLAVGELASDLARSHN